MLVDQMEIPSGVEPEFQPYQGRVLPLNYGILFILLDVLAVMFSLSSC